VEKLGARLRIIRERSGLKLHEVESKSHQIAERRGNRHCQISGSWLDRIEREPKRSLSAIRLFTLLEIYDITLEKLLIAGEEPPDPEEQDEDLAVDSNETLLIPRGPLEEKARLLLPDDIQEPAQVPDVTELVLPKMKTKAGRYLRIIVGRDRNFLHPILPAGTLALVDTHRRSIAFDQTVDTELGRQMFLVELRDGLICCWCEWIGNDMNRLLVVPHPLSGLGSMYLRIGREATIRGQLIKLRVSLAPIRRTTNADYGAKAQREIVQFGSS
jgi:transcriptional regulator with XRE-family HTH domain